MATNDYRNSVLYNIFDSRADGILPSLKPTDGTGDFTVTRADSTPPTATEINSLGQIQNVAANTPKLTHETIGGCPVLNIEAGTTQLITYPLSFDNTYWWKTGTSIVSGQNSLHTAYPTGAFKLIEDTSTTSDHIILKAGFSLIGDVTFSIFLKMAERRYFQITSVGTATGVNRNIFDLQNGVITTNALGAFMQPMSDGWYKCGFTINEATSFSQVAMIIQNDATYASYTGDGTSGLYIFGANLTQTSSPHSFINPITEGSATVTNDDLVTGAGDINTFNGVEGSIILEFSSQGDYQISLDDGTVNNRIQFFRTLSNDQIYINLGGTLIINEIYRNTDNTTTNIYILTYKSGDIKLYVNEILLGTYTTSFTGATFNVFNFTSYLQTDSSNLKVKKAEIIKRALTTEEVTTFISTSGFNYTLNVNI